MYCLQVRLLDTAVFHRYFLFLLTYMLEHRDRVNTQGRHFPNPQYTHSCFRPLSQCCCCIHSCYQKFVTTDLHLIWYSCAPYSEARTGGKIIEGGGGHDLRYGILIRVTLLPPLLSICFPPPPAGTCGPTSQPYTSIPAPAPSPPKTSAINAPPPPSFNHSAKLPPSPPHPPHPKSQTSPTRTPSRS